MTDEWPNTEESERFEINGFIKHYEKLRKGY